MAKKRRFNYETIQHPWHKVDPGDLIIAIVAAIFGFTGIAGTSAWIAHVLFVLFLVLFVFSLLFRGRPPV